MSDSDTFGARATLEVGGEYILGDPAGVATKCGRARRQIAQNRRTNRFPHGDYDGLAAIEHATGAGDRSPRRIRAVVAEQRGPKDFVAGSVYHATRAPDATAVPRTSPP